jgi:hypothetical protein
MKILVVLFISFFSTICLSQTMTIDSVKANYKGRNYDDFYYIHPDFDSTAYRWVANITYHFDTLKYDCSIPIIFRLLETKGNELGGNAFTVSSSDIVSKNGKYVSLSIYKLRHGINWEKKNYYLFANNRAYLFGNLNNQKINYAYKTQGKTFKINNFSYVELDLPKGSDLEINVNFKKRSSSIFYYNNTDEVKQFNWSKYIIIGGFRRVSFFKYEISRGHLNQDYGQFLIHILKKQPL